MRYVLVLIWVPFALIASGCAEARDRKAPTTPAAVTVPDLVGDSDPLVPNLVRLPEECHLLREPVLGAAALRRSQQRVVEAPKFVGDAHM